MLHGPTNTELLLELDEEIYGHEHFKKALINLVNRSKIRHYQKHVRGLSHDLLMEPSKILVVGESGTGKTHTINTLFSKQNMPVVKIDASQLNVTGGSGGIKEKDVRVMIYTTAREFLEKSVSEYDISSALDRTVVFIDEIDKISSSYEGGTASWNTHLQSNFLTLFEDKDDLSGVSFVFGGAFSNTITKRSISKPIGFNYNSENLNEEDRDLSQDVINAGIIPELVGRLTSVVQLDNFDDNDYYEIMNRMLLPRKIRDLAYFGVTEADLTDEEKWRMCKIASNSGQGIRSLKRQLDAHFFDAEFNYEETRYSGLLENENG